MPELDVGLRLPGALHAVRVHGGDGVGGLRLRGPDRSPTHGHRQHRRLRGGRQLLILGPSIKKEI